MIKANKIVLLLLTLLGLLVFNSCESSDEEVVNNSSCPSLTSEIKFDFNGEKITSLDFTEKATAYFPIVENATSYEWRVNGEVIEHRLTSEIIENLPEDVLELLPEDFKNSIQIQFDRFKDAEVTLKVKTNDCTDGVITTKMYKKTPEFNACDAANFHVDITKDLQNIILNIQGVLGNITTNWTVKNEDGTTVTSTTFSNYTTALQKGVVEISLAASWSGLEGNKNCSGTTITKKIVFSEENLKQIQEDYDNNPVANHISLRLKRNDDGTYTPYYTFKN